MTGPAQRPQRCRPGCFGLRHEELYENFERYGEFRSLRWGRSLSGARSADLRRCGVTNRVHFGTRSSSGETLAALPATVLDRGAPSPGPHPMAETVTTLTTTDFRLVGPLHDISEKVDKGGLRQVTRAADQLKVRRRPGCSDLTPPLCSETACSRRIQPTREKNIRAPWQHPSAPSTPQELENAHSTRPFPVEETGQPFPQC